MKQNLNMKKFGVYFLLLSISIFSGASQAGGTKWEPYAPKIADINKANEDVDDISSELDNMRSSSNVQGEIVVQHYRPGDQIGLREWRNLNFDLYRSSRDKKDKLERFYNSPEEIRDRIKNIKYIGDTSSHVIPVFFHVEKNDTTNPAEHVLYVVPQKSMTYSNGFVQFYFDDVNNRNDVTSLYIDFDDGGGYRKVPSGKIVVINYPVGGVKSFRGIANTIHDKNTVYSTVFMFEVKQLVSK